MTCCSPSQTTALFPALSDHHPLQLHLSWTFCIISVSILPHICRTDRYVSSVFQKWRKYGRIKVATSGLNWPQSTLLITHYRVTNLPLSVTVVCSVEILIARINYYNSFYFTCLFYFVIIFVRIISNWSPELFGRLQAEFLRLLSTCNLNVSYHHIWFDYCPTLPSQVVLYAPDQNLQWLFSSHDAIPCCQL